MNILPETKAQSNKCNIYSNEAFGCFWNYVAHYCLRMQDHNKTKVFRSEMKCDILLCMSKPCWKNLITKISRWKKMSCRGTQRHHVFRVFFNLHRSARSDDKLHAVDVHDISESKKFGDNWLDEHQRKKGSPSYTTMERDWLINIGTCQFPDDFGKHLRCNNNVSDSENTRINICG